MTTPATNVDTTGVVGNTGAVPLGSQFKSAAVKDTSEIGAGGSVTARPGPPLVSATPATSGTDGTSATHVVPSTALSGTLDTTLGYAGNMTPRTYRAPANGVPASIVDTTRAYGSTAAVPAESYPWNSTGTMDTVVPSMGAPSGRILSQTDIRVIDHTTPTTVSAAGVLGAASSLVVVNKGLNTAVSAEAHTIDHTTPFSLTNAGVIEANTALVVVNNGQIIAVTDESHVLSGLTPFSLTNPGVTTAIGSIVVKKGATTLVVDTDYTIVATGSGATANFTITPIDSATVNPGDTLLVTYSYGNAAHFVPVTLALTTDYTATLSGTNTTRNYAILRNNASTACADGDSVAVSYHYGNAAYWTNVPLVLTTDYTVTFTGGLSTRTFTVLRNNASSSVADGESVSITYSIGDATYWGTHDPAQAPPAPTIGTAVAGDRKVKVVWTNPTLTAADDIDGYLIMSDTGGTRYVPGGNLNYWFENVVPGQAYRFKVAAFNEAGLGPFSALSNAVVPANYDETPTGSLDPKNCVNPIYDAAGNILAGTNLGP